MLQHVVLSPLFRRQHRLPEMRQFEIGIPEPSSVLEEAVPSPLTFQVQPPSSRVRQRGSDAMPSPLSRPAPDDRKFAIPCSHRQQNPDWHRCRLPARPCCRSAGRVSETCRHRHSRQGQVPGCLPPTVGVTFVVSCSRASPRLPGQESREGPVEIRPIEFHSVVLASGRSFGYTGGDSGCGMERQCRAGYPRR